MPVSTHKPPAPANSVEEPRGSVWRPSAAMLTAITTWVLAIYFAVVLESPYWNDDLINRNLRATLRAAHTTLGAYIWGEISAFVGRDARFDPVLLGWTFSLFDVFDNRNSYKLIVGLVLVLALATVGLCVAKIASNWIPGAAFVLIVAGTLQVRPWSDGLVSFAGIIPLTAIFTFSALLVLLLKPGVRWTVFAGGLYLIALFSYEVVFLFSPVLVLIVFVRRRDWRPALAIAIPAAIALLLDFSFRVFGNPHPVPEYTLNWTPHLVLETFAKQMLAALPLSQWWLGHNAVPPIAGTLVLTSAIALGIPVFVGMSSLAGTLRTVAPRTLGLYALLGAWMWVTPAVLIGLTERWQTGIPWGEGYISVVFEYLGLALCLLALWLWLDGRLRRRFTPAYLRAWTMGSAFLVATLATVTMAGNLSVMP